jgi:hypothetical protein
MIDVLSYGPGGDLQDVSWNAVKTPNKWTYSDLNINDIHFSYPIDVIAAAPFVSSTKSTGFDSLMVYESGLIVNFTGSSSARSIVESFPNSTSNWNRGTAAIATNGPWTVAVWFSNPLAQYTAVLFNRGKQFSSAYTFTSPGVFYSPPQVVWGNDGYPEVLGMGADDGCLWETYLDFFSGKTVVNGPYQTGICGLR